MYVGTMLICMQVQCGFDTYFSDTAIWALFWLLQQCQVVATIVARAHLYLIVYILVDIQHSLQHLTGEWCPFQKLLNFRDLSSTDSNLVNLCHGLGREVDAKVFCFHLLLYHLKGSTLLSCKKFFFSTVCQNKFCIQYNLPLVALPALWNSFPDEKLIHCTK